MAKAEIYQWTDEHGQLHFGDRPPQDRQSSNISETLQSINISNEFSSPEMLLKHEQLKTEERQKAFDAHQQSIDQQRSLSKACRDAKIMLKKLTGRVVFVDEQGRDLGVSEKERQKRAQEMKDAVKIHCQ